MKKIISMIFVFVLILSLCACGTSQGGEEQNTQAAAEGLQVGYSKVDMTPDLSQKIKLGGYGNAENRIATTVLDKLYATCLAVREGENTVLLFGADVARSRLDLTNDVRQMINEALGIPTENIVISATHTHSAPSINGSNDNPTFELLYKNAMLQAAQEAVADLAPATIYATKVQTDDMNFVRHYKNALGGYCGDGFGDKLGSVIVDYATEGDPEMILVKYDRPEDKKDIMVMNFQAHPCFTGSEKNTDISADFIGFTRKIIEDETDMNFLYFTGAAGNQNTQSYISEENDIPNINKYCEKLAQYAIDALDDMEQVEGQGVKVVVSDFTLPSNKSEVHKVAQAKEVLQLMEKGDASYKEKMQEYGISSNLHAENILRQPGYEQEITMQLHAIYAGGVAYITAPYEMFSNSSLFIKENSPFKYTVICTCANHAYGYYATEEAYDYFSYEAVTSRFAKGVAEKTADEFVRMLKSLQ